MSLETRTFQRPILPSRMRDLKDNNRALEPNLFSRTVVAGILRWLERSETTQAEVLRQTIGSVESVSYQYGVTDLRWFALRDANTASGQLENGYGLLRDDYTLKPAFTVYQQIIAAEGA